MHPPRGAGGPADGNAGGGAIPPDPGGVSNKRGSQQEGQAAGGAGNRRGRQRERQTAGEADSRRGTQESPPRSSKSRDEPPGNRRKSEPPDRSEGASCKKEQERTGTFHPVRPKGGISGLPTKKSPRASVAASARQKARKRCRTTTTGLKCVRQKHRHRKKNRRKT